MVIKPWKERYIESVYVRIIVRPQLNDTQKLIHIKKESEGKITSE